MSNGILLTFYGEKPQLIQTSFSRAGQEQRLCIRGKTAGSFQNAGTFQWTTAVQALCVVLIKTRLADLEPATRGAESSASETLYLSGLKGSPAASLDYALVKQPMWLTDMFGTDATGVTYARRLINRTNSQRKLPGPVTLSINLNVLAPADIRIMWNDELVSSAEQLENLLSLIGDAQVVQAPEPVADSALQALAA
jgi:hypothetical protein